MGSGKINLPPLAMLVVIVLQFIMIQVVTFFVSLLFPSLGDYPTTLPALFLYLIGLLFTVGIYLTGWVAIKGGALKIERKYLARMAWTLLGTYLPLEQEDGKSNIKAIKNG
jgi:hypothetical protein